MKKEDSREDAKQAKFGEDKKIFFVPPWCLGAKIFVELVLLNIVSVRILICFWAVSGSFARSHLPQTCGCDG